MSRYIFLVKFIILAFLVSCSQTEQSDLTVVSYYDNGNLKKLQDFKNDTIEHGRYLFYYPSGVLKDSARITNGKFHGKRFEYYENGQLYALTNYINDKEREGIVYRLDGTLQYYKAFNYNIDLMFIIHYDSLGKPIKYDGELIYSWVQEESYPVGKEFSVELLVADPPHCVTEIRVSDWNIKENRATFGIRYTPDRFNRVNYSRKQNPDADMYILHVATIQDTIEQTSINDTLVIMVDKEGKSSNARQLPKW